MFQFTLTEARDCSLCRQQQTTTKSELTLNVLSNETVVSILQDVTYKTVDVQTLVNRYQRPQPIDGTWACGCATGVRDIQFQTTTTSISSAANYLLITFAGRVSYAGRRVVKNRTPLDINDQLTVLSTPYKLKAVVVHRRGYRLNSLDSSLWNEKHCRVWSLYYLS